MTKGRKIIMFVKSQPPFDAQRQYLDVSGMHLQARVSRFCCHCFVDFLNSSSIIIGFYLPKAIGSCFSFI